MFKYALALLIGITAVCQAEITEKPIKLDEPAAQQNGDQIIFPPATEPYKPMPMQPVAPQAQTAFQQPQNQQIDQFQRAEQQYKQQNQPSQPAFSNVPVSGYGAGSSGGREAIERAADNCESELAQLWQQKGSIDPSRMPQFQKCMGQAKMRCDQLKEASKAIKQGDVHLSNYEGFLQQARDSLR